MKASEIQMDETIPHGTREGYAAGCQGSHCPGTDKVGMSCLKANMRFASDLSYRRRIESGMSPEAIFADDQLEDLTAVAAPKKVRNERVEEPTQITVADSVEPFVAEADEEPAADEVAPDAVEAAARSHAEKIGIAYEKHGETKGYYAGCREGDSCPGIIRVGRSCAAAVNEYQKDLKARKKAEQDLIAPKGKPEPADAVAEAEIEARVDAVYAELEEERAKHTAVAVESAAPVELSEPHPEAQLVEVRAEGLLSDLADARDMIESLEAENDRLARDLAQTISDHVDEETRVRGLQKQHDDDVARITKLQDELTQVSLRLDVESSEKASAQHFEAAEVPAAPATSSTSDSAMASLAAIVRTTFTSTVGGSRHFEFTFDDGRLQQAVITTGN